MSDHKYHDYIYFLRPDYDKTIKINNENAGAYSKKKINELHPDKNFTVFGETFENKKRNKDKDIGRIEINDRRLYIEEPGTHSKIFKRQAAFIATDDGKYIAVLKTRIIIFILLGILVLGLIGGGIWLGSKPHVDPDKPDPYIEPIESDVITISGVITLDDQAISDAVIVLKNGNTTIQTTTTGSDGKYLFNNVKKGVYNLQCTYGDSIQTKMVTIEVDSVTLNFNFDNDSSVKAIVKVDENTPDVLVGGLTEEANHYAEDNKEVDVTLFVTKKEEESLPTIEVESIDAISGELELNYFDFSVLKEIFTNAQKDSSEYLKNTKTVLEIVIPYDSSYAVGTYVFRYHSDAAIRLEELESQPESNYKDGTYYVTNNYVYIYTNSFSTYAIGSAFTDHSNKGVDSITYSSNVTVNLTTKKITMLYKHDEDSTNDARIEIYLVGSAYDLLISESGIVPVGYQLNTMVLLDDLEGLPSVGTYEGKMLIKYVGQDAAQVITQIEIPLYVTLIR